MSHKKFFSTLLAVVLLSLSAWLFLAYLIDPIGIWGAPVVRGFNHYKAYQGRYLDVYKPYEYMREKPDILYIGASKMYVGFEPICRTHPEKKVYTLGLSSLSLPNMREYLRFVYKTHKPEVIYMGLNPEDFGVGLYRQNRQGYSKKRLERLAGSNLTVFLQAVKDSMSLRDVYWRTVDASQANRQKEAPFLRGWDVTRGTADAPNPKIHYFCMWHPIARYTDWIYEPEAIECLRTIASEAKEAGVPLIAFFVPSSADHDAVTHLIGRWEDYQYRKLEASKILPVYDFAFVNELTANMQAYFFDASHFRATLGEKLKPCLESGNPAPYGYLLRPETADEVFAKEDAAWEKWKAENQEFVNALKECIETGRTPKAGEFEKYIGF